VPFGLLLARLLKGVDLRTIGSGNIGATNTMRALGRPWGVFAFLLDLAKGWLPAFWFAALASSAEGRQLASVLCGAAAVVGHCFPVYLRFRGGKGVATACGAMVAIDPLVFLIGGSVWLLAALALRYVSLASILMGVTFPLAAWWRHPDGLPLVLGASALTVLIIVRHRANIARMLAGTEPRMGAAQALAQEEPHG
jgi:glycerol-3-phosphate acyltransferase PlsY